MRIAILGAGNVGGGLGTAFSAVGHEVAYGVRDPDSPKTQAAIAASGGRAGDPASAVDGADVVVFALRWDAVPDTIAALPSLDGRIVIDAMNRFGTPTSTTDDLVRLLPGAKVVKCFNTIGAENFATARRRAAPAVMFAAGDDPDAKRIALELATEIGFRAEDAGGLANAKPLEEMVKIWLALTAQHGRGLGSPCPTGKRPSGAPPWRGGSGRRGDLSRGAGIPEAGRGGADRRDVDVAPLRDAWPTRRDRSRPTKGPAAGIPARWDTPHLGSVPTSLTR
jgi:predicted dinucleotide-binding enzyme